MALTDETRAYYRSRLGATLDEPDLELRFARLGSHPAVASEVLQERIATAITQPLSFSIPGDYSEDRKDNVAHMRAMLERAEADEAGLAGPDVLVAVPGGRRWGR